MFRALIASAAVAATLVAVAGCSNGDGDDPASTRASATSFGGPSTPAPSASAASPAPTQANASPAATAGGTQRAGSAQVRSGDWLLLIAAPRAGDRIGRRIRICYQLSGATREPDVALDAQLIPVDVRAPRSAQRHVVDVGGGSLDVTFAETDGRFDLSITLVSAGRPVPGMTLRVPVVLHTPAKTANCP
jgi:hypothetical protein